MTRVNVLVEGQTEESFIKDVLAPALYPRQIFLTPIILGSPGKKGGNPTYPRVKTDLLLLLKQQSAAYCTMMLDFYGLGSAFPGTPLPPNLPNIEKVSRIEQAVAIDITATLDAGLRPDIRFVPYLQLHEYEGLLFSDPVAFASGISRQDLAPHFENIRRQFATPEDINDDVNTAPSKRVLALYPSYRKPLDGTRAAKAVGIDTMRRECPHFHGWVERLESLGTNVEL
jgi:Domain of unknown function (DUF4276)